MVTDLEKRWQNSVVERRGALFKMAFEKASSLEAPMSESEIQDFRTANEFCGRQLRLPSSLLEGDFDPYTCRTPTTRCAEARLCEWQPPTSDDDSTPQSTSETGGHWWLENPSSCTDGRMEPKDGVYLACAS